MPISRVIAPPALLVSAHPFGTPRRFTECPSTRSQLTSCAAEQPAGPAGNTCATLAPDGSRRAALLVVFIRPVCALSVLAGRAPRRAQIADAFPAGPPGGGVNQCRRAREFTLSVVRLAQPCESAQERFLTRGSHPSNVASHRCAVSMALWSVACTGRNRAAFP